MAAVEKGCQMHNARLDRKAIVSLSTKCSADGGFEGYFRHPTIHSRCGPTSSTMHLQITLISDTDLTFSDFRFKRVEKNMFSTKDGATERQVMEL